jgi:hypothetical protein
VRLWGRPNRKRPSRNNHKILIAGNYAKIATRPQSPYQPFVRAVRAYTTQTLLKATNPKPYYQAYSPIFLQHARREARCNVLVGMSDSLPPAAAATWTLFVVPQILTERGQKRARDVFLLYIENFTV